MHGHFTGSDLDVPPDEKVPTGNTMAVVVSAATGLITDLGITNHVPALSTLGTPTKL